VRRPGRAFDPAAPDATPEHILRGAVVDALGWWPCAPEPWEGPLCRALRGALPLARPHAFAGGMGTLAAAVAQPLDLVTDCEVLRVESDSEGAYLAYRRGAGAYAAERRERADAVVVAAPATRVARLCPKLTPEERGFFEGVRSEAGVVVHLMFERAPEPTSRSVLLGRESGLEVSALHAEHARAGAAPLGAGLLRAQLAPRAAARMFRASDASIADLVVENLAYSPVGPRTPDDYAVWRHADLAPRFDAEHARRLTRFLRRLERSPRLAFAGDFLAGTSADGAVASGLAAAREIARAV
ncbi:MAG: FAD-dependent oxidoreductase, partial [Myxococcota bacterium]